MYMSDPVNPESEGVPFEALLSQYPDISVQRSRVGFLDIGKALPDGSAIWETIVLHEPTERTPSPEILISAQRHIEGVQPTWTENWRTYISIKRPQDGNLEAEVIYPKREEQRLDYAEMLKIAMQGLELFDAYKTRATPYEKGKYFGRVFDFMGDRETDEDIEEINRTLDTLMPGLKPFDYKAAKGGARMVWNVLKNVSNLRITNIHPNSV